MSDDDAVVLAMFSDSPPEPVTARWRVTAQGTNDVLEGTLEIPVIALDWRDAIDKRCTETRKSRTSTTPEILAQAAN